MRAVAPAVALLIGLSVHAAHLEAQGTIVVLVRHAEKASASGDPGLTSDGEARARALADALQRFRLDGVVVSQYRRTQATASPAAIARGLVPVVVPVGTTVAAHADSVAAAVRRFPPRSAVLVVGHSNTLGPIIAALGGPATSDLCDAEYATMFVLAISEDGAPARLLRASVGTPDPATATACQHPVTPAVTVQASPTSQLLVGLFPVNERVVWASGAGGTYVVTTDGGDHWRAGVVPGAEGLQFRDVHATDSLTAWLLAIGFADSSRVYHTTDGGRSWQMQFVNRDPGAFYDCFAFWDPRRAIAISDGVRGRAPILLTADGGVRWEILPAEAQPVVDSAEGSPAASGTCVVAHGLGNAWFGTIGSPRGARVFRTTDGGRSWQGTVTPIGSGSAGSGVASLAFRDALHGFAGGGDTRRIARTDDGGRTWVSVGEPTFAGGVYGLAVAPGSRGALVAVGRSGSSISWDDGQSWRSLDAGDSWSVAFASADTGWMVGARGRIAKIGGNP
jgi:photosystem II stability/assembly factor-like uncharacterized protein/broad specificity phosphatase PhoE